MLDKETIRWIDKFNETRTNHQIFVAIRRSFGKRWTQFRSLYLTTRFIVGKITMKTLD